MFFGRVLKQRKSAVINMTSTEVEKLIRDALTTAGLWDVVDQYKSQFLEFPDGFFTEIVLSDGSKLVDAEGIVRQVEEGLRRQSIELDVIVRAVWTVLEVDGPVPTAEGIEGMRFPWVAVLGSGGLTTKVEVDVTHLAVIEIKQRFAARYQKDGKAVMKEVITEFLRLQLSFGGESYWDPIRYPRQELNDSALLYLFGHNLV